MGLFSKELQILDKNTVQYMIDQMQDTIDEQQNTIAQKNELLASQEVLLQQKEKELEQLKKKNLSSLRNSQKNNVNNKEC